MSLLTYFKHLSLTYDQEKALKEVDDFLKGDSPAFILKGYAGSGKTTLIKGIVEYLVNLNRKPLLMAPTGRAAKVISQKTGKPATTIHKTIYSFEDLRELEINNEEDGKSFIYYYKIRNNIDVTNSVFIVDEASMLSDNLSEGEYFRFGTGYLLKDLLTFSRILDKGLKTKILFVGDPAQLPPVGMNFSPALDEDYLLKEYQLKVASAELREVKRQGGESGILKAASGIRKCLTSGFFNDFDLRENGKDIFNPKCHDFIPLYSAARSHKIIITYKNKTALDLNQEIRIHKYGSELPIQAGDQIIIGHNNYRAGIMNGEFGVVISAGQNTISRRIPFYTKGGKREVIELTWRSIELLFPDEEENGKTITGYILENYLYGDNYLTSEEQQALYVDFVTRHQNLKPKSPEFSDAIINDPFFNAIQLKFGYAVTCHKAQGGEWEEAFVFWDRGVKDGFNFFETAQEATGKTNSDFYRWAYTAVTRASKRLNCINPPYFTSFSELRFISTQVQDSFSKLTGEDLHPFEIIVDTNLMNELKSFGLDQIPVPLQDHYIELRHKVRTKFIEITGWKRVGFEIRYSFSRVNDRAALKFWINGKNEFVSKFETIPSGTNSDQLIKELHDIVTLNKRIVVKRDTADLILSKIEFDYNIEETKPFLGVLYDNLTYQCKEKKIQVTHLEHFLWMECYTFIRQEETAVVNFHYNANGFLKKVLPLDTKCNSMILLEDLRLIVTNLKSDSHVIQPG